MKEEVPDCRLSTLASRLRLAHRPTHRALDDALATIQCTVASVVDGGDHYIVIGRVLALSESTDSGRPLLFYRGQYTAIEPEKTTPAPWRADLEHFLTTTTLDTWL